MIIIIPRDYDSKFRFIRVASLRAKQIQAGASPHLEVKSGKPAYVAIREAEKNLVNYTILEPEEEEPFVY